MRDHPTLWQDLRSTKDSPQRPMAKYIEEDGYAEVAGKFLSGLKSLWSNDPRTLDQTVQGILQDLKQSELTSSSKFAHSVLVLT